MTHEETVETVKTLKSAGEYFRKLFSLKLVGIIGNGQCNDYANAIEYAVAMLQKQEPKFVINSHKAFNNVLNPNVPWVGKCPKCGKKIEGKTLTRFCKFCGQAVKWE